ncbi:putative Cyclic AMP receptor-like protein A [Glarea lozoyensis 74030]|uniref:Putative Cyclic AMP receptor-like protein A n=1 Tax=Glarea lozoyensis (strain ATCC 74030 / MF5533) TaxID=1104152 RepID=H0EVF3_GLAL7|nr:putative Cyclic AMP receptor-like protein A [Glarea lozoyensis 74030]
MALTSYEINSLIAIERITASISVLSTLILIATFSFVKESRTLSNTLIFYASFANLFSSIAALIGSSALHNENGALCQFQGFLLQMFMQSDPFWSCAIAINIYLVFFRRYDAQRLKGLYWIYGLICYGLPFISALFCLLYRDKTRGKIYGEATVSPLL